MKKNERKTKIIKDIKINNINNFKDKNKSSYEEINANKNNILNNLKALDQSDIKNLIFNRVGTKNEGNTGSIWVGGGGIPCVT